MFLLDAVSKIYNTPAGQVTALDNVHLELQRGEMVCVAGPSGSGKTTLLLILGGMLRPTHGSVRIGETELYALTTEQRARFRAEHIGFVFQMFHLVPYLNVLDNVLLSARLQKSAQPRAVELIDRLGLAHRRTHKPAQLSAGERQRTAIARAMLNRPELILADEPTGNLDTESGSLVIRFLAEFRDQGGSVLVVTHGSDAENHADRVVRMQSGAICEDSLK